MQIESINPRRSIHRRDHSEYTLDSSMWLELKEQLGQSLSLRLADRPRLQIVMANYLPATLYWTALVLLFISLAFHTALASRWCILTLTVTVSLGNEWHKASENSSASAATTSSLQIRWSNLFPSAYLLMKRSEEENCYLPPKRSLTTRPTKPGK